MSVCDLVMITVLVTLGAMCQSKHHLWPAVAHSMELIIWILCLYAQIRGLKAATARLVQQSCAQLKGPTAASQ